MFLEAVAILIASRQPASPKTCHQDIRLRLRGEAGWQWSFAFARRGSALFSLGRASKIEQIVFLPLAAYSYTKQLDKVPTTLDWERSVRHAALQAAVDEG
jgi:hypothetical protein